MDKTYLKCSDGYCKEPAVPNQTAYGIPLKLCTTHLEEFRGVFETDPQLRRMYLDRSKNQQKRPASQS